MVLVPTLPGDQEHHEASLGAFLRFGKRQACCAAHSVPEVHATFIRIPGKYGVSCEQAMLFLTSQPPASPITVDLALSAA